MGKLGLGLVGVSLQVEPVIDAQANCDETCALRNQDNSQASQEIITAHIDCRNETDVNAAHSRYLILFVISLAMTCS